jgi:hypothetical protein
MQFYLIGGRLAAASGSAPLRRAALHESLHGEKARGAPLRRVLPGGEIVLLKAPSCSKKQAS